MAFLPSLRNLFIPNKTKTPTQPDYGTDMRAIESWARQPIQQLVAGSGVTLTPSNGLATDKNGNGPFPITISASGGGGGITLINSPLASIAVTNGGGPTTSIDVQNPFQNGSAWGNGTSVGVGTGALSSLTLGGGNTAVGIDALTNLTTASANTAFGYHALEGQTGAGSDNTAIGNTSMVNASTAAQNTAVGSASLAGITSGSTNVAIGHTSLTNLTTGVRNTVVGQNAGGGIVAGGFNTYVGEDAGFGGGDRSNTTLVGYGTLASGDGAVAIGVDSSNSAAAASTNEFALGTGSHVVIFRNVSTGAGSASLGANCPASTLSAPKGWIHMRDTSGGTIGYIPYWQ